MRVDKLTQNQYTKIEEAIMATFGIKGMYYADFSTYDAGVEFKAMVENLDQGTRSLSVSHTMSGENKLVILSTCSFSQAAADDIGAFFGADCDDDNLYEVRADVLDRLKAVNGEIVHRESVLKPEHQKGKKWPIDDLA